MLEGALNGWRGLDCGSPGDRSEDSNSLRSGEKHTSPCATEVRRGKLGSFGKIHKLKALFGLRWLKEDIVFMVAGGSSGEGPCWGDVLDPGR